MKNLKVVIATVAMILSAGHAVAGWECYQTMQTTTEVVANSQTEDNGSSMYTSDGYLKSNRKGVDRRISVGNSSYNASSSNSYVKRDVIRYFRVCEDNGRIVSIIEHK